MLDVELYVAEVLAWSVANPLTEDVALIVGEFDCCVAKPLITEVALITDAVVAVDASVAKPLCVDCK